MNNNNNKHNNNNNNDNDNNDNNNGNDGAIVVMVLDHVRGLVSALHGLNWSSHSNNNDKDNSDSNTRTMMSKSQHCELVFDDSGVKLCVEDDSKAVQAVASFRKEVFRSYSYNNNNSNNNNNNGSNRTRVVLSLSRLIDTLQPFVAATTSAAATLNKSVAPLQIKYPASSFNNNKNNNNGDNKAKCFLAFNDGAMEFMMLEEDDPPLRLRASLRTLNDDDTNTNTNANNNNNNKILFLDYSDSIAAEFALHGGLLKEAVDDLGWPNGAPVWLKLSKLQKKNTKNRKKQRTNSEDNDTTFENENNHNNSNGNNGEEEQGKGATLSFTASSLTCGEVKVEFDLAMEGVMERGIHWKMDDDIHELKFKYV